MDLLSKHSSNPLQAPSDDPVNAKYLRQIRPVLRREKTRGERDPSSVHRQHEEMVMDEDEVMLEDVSEREEQEEEEQLQEELEHASSSSDEEEFDPNDEEYSIHLKDPQEQAQIMNEIRELEVSLEGMIGDYKLVDRLGEGTFSSVYKAIDLVHPEVYNKPWQGYHPPSSSAHFQSVPFMPDAKVFVAIKRIYVTSSPSRIQNEIEIMEACRGCRHVSQLITAFRHRDQVVAIMPYQRNVDFRNYYTSIPLSVIQSYLRCLLRALRDVHAREIVHRDVKPANFLFDPHTGQGVLVDFGLAQRVDYDVETACNHTAASRDTPHGALKPLMKSQIQRVKNIVVEQRKKSAGPSDRVGWLAHDARPPIKANRAGTRGFRAPEVLLKCEDQTAALDIWSVGTILLSILSCRFPIFNANDDTEALMEIAAIMGKRRIEKCAQLHNRTFCTNVPTLDHNGITWEELATRLNPSLTSPTEPAPQHHSTSSPGEDYQHVDPEYSRATDPLLPQVFDLLERMLHHDMTKRITAREALAHPFLVERVRLYDEDEDLIDGDAVAREPQVEVGEWTDPETGETIIAKGDDLYVPHPIGEGVCARGHWREEETQSHYVFLVLPEEEPPKNQKQARKRAKRDEILNILALEMGEGEETKTVRVQAKHLVAGEGVAIGVEPCEYHKDGIIDAKYWEMYGPNGTQRETGYTLVTEELGNGWDDEDDGMLAR